MNRNFRTLSALLRTDWCIDEQYARDHEDVINALLAGTYTPRLLFGDDDDEEEKPIAYTVSLSASGSSASLTRHELDDEDMPENSILVVPISGPIFKEGFCGSAGALDYAQAINQAYANPKIIGTIQLVDSPGGQLSGTPTLYDAIRNPAKPSITLVHDGMMASAALWLSAGSTKIYASQPTDQIGSIGVFVTLRDNSQAMEKAGYKTIHVYSDLSPDKNKTYREALAGNTKLLREDLNRAAGLFHAAVKTGRGDRLKEVEKDGADPFKGGMFYADDAIQLGLIDGYSSLEAAVTEINELHKNSTRNSRSARFAESETPVVQGESTDQPALLEAPVAAQEAAAIPTAEPDEPADSQPQSNQNSTDMFGDKHKKLTGLAGATAVSDEQLNDINANLDSLNIKGVRVISAAYLQEAEEAIQKASTLENERDEWKQKAEAFGSQPGHLGSQSQKAKEEATGDKPEKLISEVDQELLDREAKIKRHD